MGIDMKACVFFGHAQQNYDNEYGKIEGVIEHLIKEKGVVQFYSGGRGAFDAICSNIVASLKKRYPHIKSTLVYSYLPQKKEEFLPEKYDDSVYLLEERVPPKYAIVKTNEAMIDCCDFVVTAVQRSWGGAAKAYHYAKRKQKNIINIYQYEPI